MTAPTTPRRQPSLPGIGHQERPAGTLGPVSAFVVEQIEARLEERRVAAWYDGERAFGDLLPRMEEILAARGHAVVSTVPSRLRARRDADAVYRRLGEPDAPAGLLIYLPTRRGRTEQERQADPFEVFARVGTAFGDDEGEQLRALATAALPGHRAAIDRLFAEGQPTLATLDALVADGGTQYPLLRQALGTDVPVEALALALSLSDADERLARVPGAHAELERLAEVAVGFAPQPLEPWAARRDRLAAFLLLGELAVDLPEGLPPGLAGVAHASGAGCDVALAVCARLRETDAGREALARLAPEIEERYRVAQALGPEPPLGTRDTFPIQERARLRAVVRLAEAGDLAGARAAFSGAADAVWRRQEDRIALWAAAGHCLAFLEVAAEMAGEKPAGRLRGLIERYVAADGTWRLDAAQRRFEQAAAACAHDQEVEPLIHHCRARYLAVVEPVQAAFQAAVQAEGWPPEGIRRQTRIFDDHVAPELADRRRVAMVLVDSLRYEMARDLAAALADAGSVELEAAAAALPTTTPNGMAALLPGADGALALLQQGSELVPAIGGALLPGLKERQEYLRARFGDRYQDIELDAILQTASKRLEKQVGNADLLVVRSLDLDDLGEGRSSFRARKVMTSVLGEVKMAIERLAAIGFSTFVVTADHGHVLMPEPEPGDVVPVPPGEWLLRKRRSLIGRHQASAAGVLIVKAADVGIRSDMTGLELVVARGFKTFREDAGYFHEGLSLQECIIPVLTLRVKSSAGALGGGEQVTIAYRSDRFTSSVVGLKVSLTAMFSPTLVVRLEAFDGSGPKARRIGQAGDCDARDPVTGEVTLRSGAETPVPLLIDPDFRGPSIEVRATDPRTGVIYGRLRLTNDRLD